MKANTNWNNWRFQLHWNKLEWLDTRKINIKKNPLYYSTHKLCIKYGK